MHARADSQVAATSRLASLSPAAKDYKRGLLPEFANARDHNFEVALGVLEAAIEEKVANLEVPKDQYRDYAKRRQWGELSSLSVGIVR